MGLPSLIAERLFAKMDKNKDEMQSLAEFKEGSARLFTKKFEDNVNLMFDLFDFDNDGFITGEDIRLLLSHVPITQILGSQGLDAAKEGKFTHAGCGQ